eukprot:1916576-Pleurochrysis_carterae.AAC.1
MSHLFTPNMLPFLSETSCKQLLGVLRESQHECTRSSAKRLAKGVQRARQQCLQPVDLCLKPADLCRRLAADACRSNAHTTISDAHSGHRRSNERIGS